MSEWAGEICNASAKVQLIRLKFQPACPIWARFRGNVWMILEGRRIAPGPLAGRGEEIRTPQGAMPRNPAARRGYTRAEG